jgi:ubiquinone/menaquinone biosynthesis C-methylase UbiE
MLEKNKRMPRTSQRGLETYYEPNLRLARAYRFAGYNAGYAEVTGLGSFEEHQKDLVWRLLGDVHIGPESIVLDVGCGIGGPSAWIFERYQPARLIGIDYCNASVRVANQRWDGRERRPLLLQGDAHRLPLPDESVDVIFNLESALHYADKPAFLAECQRTLRPGGILCLGDFCTRYKKLFAALSVLDLLKNQFSTYANLWSSKDYLEAFSKQGLRLIRHEQVSRQAANSLKDGTREVSRTGWKAARGYRGRFFYLCLVEILLRRGWLAYDLFAVLRP